MNTATTPSTRPAPPDRRARDLGHRVAKQSAPRTLAHRSGLLLLGIAALLLVVTNPVGSAVAQGGVGSFEETDCFDGVDASFTCGLVTVPEQHGVPDGPTITIPVAIRKADSVGARPDPLFLAQGGPGGDAFAVFGASAPLSSVAKTRDLVIFNQRGTLYSEPDLLCEEVFDIVPETLAELDQNVVEKLTTEASQQCFDRLTGEGIDLDAFNSLENARDLDVIRQALGYDSYNYYGVSYGTLLGLHLVAEQPPALRSVVLDSVVTPQLNFVERAVITENRAYDENFAFCTNDPTCAELYPDLDNRLFALYDELDDDPVELELTDSETDTVYDAVLTGSGLRSFIFGMLYVPDFYAVLPRIVADVEAGDYAFVQRFSEIFAFDRTLSQGMYNSVFCAEDDDFTVDTLDTAGIRPFLIEDYKSGVGAILDICDVWAVDRLPASVDAPAVSDIPTMLFSGRFDPITPPAYAELAAETLANSYNYVNPTGSHGNFFNGNDCTDSILQQFLDTPDSEPNAACLADSELADVLPTNTVRYPILQKLGSVGVLGSIGALLAAGLVLAAGFIFWPLRWLVRKIRRGGPVIDDRRDARIGRILTRVTGIMTLVFLAGLAVTIVSIKGPIALYGDLPSGSRWLFVLPPLMLILAITTIVFQARAWRLDGPVWRKVHTSLTLLCLTGVALLTLTLGLIPPLYS